MCGSPGIGSGHPVLPGDAGVVPAHETSLKQGDAAKGCIAAEYLRRRGKQMRCIGRCGVPRTGLDPQRKYAGSMHSEYHAPVARQEKSE
jgi:hypothetical protein